MKIDELVAVGGLPGIFKMVANRSNGLIVEDMDSGKRRFASSRSHQFTPLASIGIYSDDDTTPLRLVFKAMLEQLESNPPVGAKSSNDDVRNYFVKILPNYDPDRVYISDIKKVIKWFNFLNDRKLITIEELAEEPENGDKEASEESKVKSNPKVVNKVQKEIRQPKANPAKMPKKMKTKK